MQFFMCQDVFWLTCSNCVAGWAWLHKLGKCENQVVGSWLMIYHTVQWTFTSSSHVRFSILSHPNFNKKLVWPHNQVEPTHPTTETFKAYPGNTGSWFLVCNLILTQLDELWKTTSIFGRQSHFFPKWKTTSMF
jgi:hypothetical protein